jgi:hypothetical protein
MKFTSCGYIKGNSVEVENVKYWIGCQDLLRVAQAQGIKTEGLKISEFGIDGTKVRVVVHRDELGAWAELTNQQNWCPVVI